MLDRFNREITYLRISVTDRCNLRCTYCMPEEGVPLISHNDVLRLEEIRDFTQVAVSMGIRKIKLTGGEPLVRKGVISLVSMLSHIDGIDDFGMTTNAIVLPEFAKDLKTAGLQRLNISLDTLDPDLFRKLTRGGDLAYVLNGIDAAEAAGFTQIKINCVIEKSPEEKHAAKVKQFAEKRGYPIRFIRKMDLAKGEFWQVIGGDGGNCKSCGRLRLTSDGFLKPCLFSNIGVNIRDGYEKAIIDVVNLKPEQGEISMTNKFYNVGG